MIRILTVLFFVLAFCSAAHAQLTANFSVDKVGGCSPLLVQFTNTTTGTSAGASYQWEFDNGNTSTLKNPGAIFTEEKSYSVKLTVRDGNQSSSKTMEITVYKKPTVDFTASLQKGCAPLPVDFTANATAGSGTIVGYDWDFGDGSMQAYPSGQATHTYTEAQNAAISLTVTNNHGCYATVAKPDVVTVLPSLTASFQAEKTTLCRETDSVQFSNTSTGPGTLQYLWNFGDGKTSTEKQPGHAFNKRGAYTVSLTVKNSDGCMATKMETDYLNVANFKTAFSQPSLVCNSSWVSLYNQSSPSPTSVVWEIDGNPYYHWGNDMQTFFNNAGKYTIKLNTVFGTCKDSAVSVIDVKEKPALQGFVADVVENCGAPSLVKFRDTTKDAVKWDWDFNYNYAGGKFTSTQLAPSHTYDLNASYNVLLRVTNAAGCSTEVFQFVRVYPPNVFLQLVNSSGSSTQFAGCDSLRISLKAGTDIDSITQYLWNFGDGYTSSEAEPTHLFTKTGSYLVSLQYTTANGCKGTQYFYSSFSVHQKPNAEFTSLSGTTICGNTPVLFQRDLSTNGLWAYWQVDGIYHTGYYYNQFEHRFQDTGSYTITHVVMNDGCRDTVTKVNYIQVKSPQVKITEVRNTCEGNRGLVTFTQRSNPGEKWTWNFGDGHSVTTTTQQLEVSHQYTKTGQYTATLTVTSGACTLQDAVPVYVMIKQAPKLTAAKTTVCADESLPYTLSNLEISSYPGVWVYHYAEEYQYGDGTTTSTLGDYYYENWIKDTTYQGSIKQLQKGQDSVRVITREVHFNCLDTSNYIPIKVIGAQACFSVVKDQQCFYTPVQFKDTSNPYNTKITNWEWDFGDNSFQTYPQGGTVSHTYKEPGVYAVRLRVRDTSGCVSSSAYSSATVQVYGPKAAFVTSGTSVNLNATVYFQNTTNSYGSYGTVYTWNFGDGSPLSNDYSPSHTYQKAGTYTVKLTAFDAGTGCRSEATQVIVVKNFNSAFSVNTSFLSSANCPPMVARFTNTSVNYTHVKWDFGDGFTAGNVNQPVHLYEKPGKYIVTLHVFAPNGVEGKFIDSIFVSVPSNGMKADLLQSCTAQTINFSASGDKMSNYWWDFGDGTLQQGSDSVQHLYKNAGVYKPRLMVSDANGCLSATGMAERIVIDSLAVRINDLPATLCTPKTLALQAMATTADPLSDKSYLWTITNGTLTENSSEQSPVFNLTQTGSFQVKLKVTTPSGCVKEVTETVTAFQGLGATINGPDAICQDGSVQFRGATLLPGNPQWTWLYHDGTTVNAQNPPAKTYNQPGNYTVKLVVNNNGCQDTVTKTLMVNPKPVNILVEKDALVCRGSAYTLTASGGATYQWSPATGLSATTGSTVLAAPQQDATYTVTATTDKGCSQAETIKIKVAQPIAVQLSPEAQVCAGSTVTLAASGATQYQWIGNTAGLNNTMVGNPVASPLSTSAYTVVGKDAFNCFTDTATVNVRVIPLPTVDAGLSLDVLAGTTGRLQSTASSDVVSWNWTPADYLSCTTCPAPETKPFRGLTYTLSVKNAAGCLASDTVSVRLLCSDSRIFIPTSFTPNADGKNDRFRIRAEGIKEVKSFRIYNRWGELVFEKKNFAADDANAAWDGRHRGQRVPEGSYVFFAELTCNDQVFQHKGTVTVVY